MAKPFSIQAPENIAKEYAGNKQKIAQAAQMGIVDPTAAVLAGMFIDRMRSAQVMEAGQSPTVAQQVLGGQPPQSAPPPPQQGIGVPPQGMPMPPQGMGAPPQQMPMAPPPQDMPMAPPPQGMAAGGLTTLPVPDAMFDEPENGSYAGGGMVAFADGGGVDFERFRRAIIDQESGGDYGIANAEGSGAMGAYQFMPPTARALAERLGLPYRPELLQGEKGRSKEGRAYQDALGTAQLQDAIKFGGGDIGKAGAFHFAGPNKEGHGPKTRQYERDILRRYSGSREGSEMMPERDLSTSQGQSLSAEDAMAFGRRVMGGMPNEELERARKYALEELDPATQEKRVKADMWQTLTEIGFGMASSKSPYVLQAIGEAASAAMPGARADKKERKAAKDTAIRTLMAVEDVDRKTAVAGVELGMDVYKTGMSAAQAERALDFQREELKSRETNAGLDREATLAAAALRASNPDKFDIMFSAYKTANPGFSDAQIIDLMRTKGLVGGSQSGMGGLPGVDQETGGAGGPQPVLIGSRPA